MGYTYYDYEEKRLQRKLIPLNLFVMILCLVAAISLMVTPFIQVDMGKVVTTMQQSENEGSSEEGSSAEGNMYAAIFGSMDKKMSLSPLDLGKMTFAKEELKAQALIKSMILDTGVFDELMTSMTNMMFVTMAGVENIEEFEGLDFAELEEAFVKLDEVNSAEEFKSCVDEYVSVLETQLDSTLDEDAREELHKICDDLYSETVAATGGDFSIESMICVSATKAIDENAEPITTYEELFVGIMDGSVKLPGAEEGGGIDEMLAPINEALNEYAGYLSYIFYAFCGFAGLWIILFLFAFLHMFAKNKRFMMWYVKLFGGIPCLIFGVAFKILAIPSVAASFFGEGAMAMVAMLGAFSTLTWISGACYLLLWLVSIFWAFPIKHKIRKLRK